MTTAIYDPRNSAHQDALLKAHNVEVTRDDLEEGWCLDWEHGCMFLTKGEEADSRAMAALFVHWWLNKNHPEGITDPGFLRDAAYHYFRSGSQS